MGSIVKITICKEYYIVLIQHEVYHTGKHCVHPQRLFKFGSREEPPVQRKSFSGAKTILVEGADTEDNNGEEYRISPISSGDDYSKQIIAEDYTSYEDYDPYEDYNPYAGDVDEDVDQ